MSMPIAHTVARKSGQPKEQPGPLKPSFAALLGGNPVRGLRHLKATDSRHGSSGSLNLASCQESSAASLQEQESPAALQCIPGPHAFVLQAHDAALAEA